MCRNKAEFDAAVARYRHLNTIKKQAEAELDAVKEEIIDYVTKKGKDSGKNNGGHVVYGEGYKVSVTPIVKANFDTEKLQAFFGDSLPNFQKMSEYNKVIVS
jgi:hypothetical protein